MRLDEAGLTCLSSHLQLKAGALALEDRELAVLFDEAHALGAHYVVSSGIFAPGSAGVPTLEDYRVMADRVNALARSAKQAGAAVRVSQPQTSSSGSWRAAGRGMTCCWSGRTRPWWILRWTVAG